MWQLNDNTYFSFIKNPDTDPEIIVLHIGKKFGNHELKEKYTLTMNDAHYREKIAYSENKWREIINDPNSIIGCDHIQQMGGTLRNTLDELLTIGTHFGGLPKAEFNLLLLGGNGATTNVYETHLHEFNDRSSNGNFNVKILRDPNWATHQAYVFKGAIPNHETMKNEAFRTLYRYQGKQKSFDKEIIRAWFNENRLKTYEQDVFLVNSLKNPGFIEETARVLYDFQGKKIIAPTDNMLESGWEDTEYMMNSSNVTICNMKEAAQYVTQERIDVENLSKKEKKEIVIALAKQIGNGRTYISDDKYAPYLITNLGSKATPNITLQTLTPFPVEAINKVNAGDIWTARILRDEIYSTPNGIETLIIATAYASCFVSREYTNDKVTQEVLSHFLSQYKPELKSETIR